MFAMINPEIKRTRSKKRNGWDVNIVDLSIDETGTKVRKDWRGNTKSLRRDDPELDL